MIQVDIKDKIRDLTGKSIEENIALSMVLDCGSASISARSWSYRPFAALL